jgi:hypothetical protein
MRKETCPGKPIASAIESDGTHRLNPISHLVRADAMRIIPDKMDACRFWRRNVVPLSNTFGAGEWQVRSWASSDLH